MQARYHLFAGGCRGALLSDKVDVPGTLQLMLVQSKKLTARSFNSVAGHCGAYLFRNGKAQSRSVARSLFINTEKVPTMIFFSVSVERQVITSFKEPLLLWVPVFRHGHGLGVQLAQRLSGRPGFLWTNEKKRIHPGAHSFFTVFIRL